MGGALWVLRACVPMLVQCGWREWMYEMGVGCVCASGLVVIGVEWDVEEGCPK